MNNSVKYIKSLVVDEKVIPQLAELPFSENGTRRLCLHDSPSASLHTMVIEAEAGAIYPPHLHTDSDEVMLVLSGRMELLVWNNGEAEKPTLVNLDSTFEINPVVLVPRLTVHVTNPVTKCIYMEVKLGPFNKTNLQVIEKEKLRF
jgi:cupin fold WbuC family metalloprotein